MRILCMAFAISMSYSCLASVDLRLAEYLANGRHLSHIQYEAFKEDQKVREAPPLEYFDMAKRVAIEQSKINANNVNVISASISSVYVQSVGGETSNIISEEEQNIYSHDNLQTCASRQIQLLKSFIFYQSRNLVNEQNETLAKINFERGFHKGMKSGLVCGQYMGIYGSLLSAGLIDDIKLLMFIKKQTEESTLKLLKLYKLSSDSTKALDKSLWSYLYKKLIITSYLGVSVKDLVLVNLKDEFKTSIKTQQVVTLESNQRMIVNFEDVISQIDIIFDAGKLL